MFHRRAADHGAGQGLDHAARDVGERLLAGHGASRGVHRDQHLAGLFGLGLDSSLATRTHMRRIARTLAISSKNRGLPPQGLQRLLQV
jgi:hypothetical protein